MLYIDITPDMFAVNHYRDALLFGAPTTSGATKNPALTTEEAWSLDKKVDDGKPGYGNVTVFENTSTNTPGCATTDIADTAMYNTALSGLKCSLVFNTEF